MSVKAFVPSFMMEEMKSVSHLYMIIFLIIANAYVYMYPSWVDDYFSKWYIQFLGITFVSSMFVYFGWVQGILTGLLFVLLLSRLHQPPVPPRAIRESFQSTVPTMYVQTNQEFAIVPDKQRWFIEQVKGEDPLLIEENTVQTSAVQDNSQNGYGGTSSVQTM